MSVDIVSLQRDQKAGLVKGVIPPNGEVALRREIDDLLQDEELANLYLLAMEAFQQASYAKTSPQNKNWFAYDPIGGIHGAPITPWDNAANLRDDQNGMYCVHGKPTFPTWHRVYLAQFEQALYLHAAELVKDLNPDPKEQQALLKKFRIPFLDPYRPRVKNLSTGNVTYGLPVILTLPKIKVKRAFRGEYKETDNPLYSFKLANSVIGSVRNPKDPFNRDPKKGTVPVTVKSTWRTTGFKSWGIEDQMQNNHYSIQQGMDGQYNPHRDVSQSAAAHGLWKLFLERREVLDKHGEAIRDPRGDKIIDGTRLFKAWMVMASHEAPSGELVRGSLESWHDNVHGNFGGTMGSTVTAGFDPAFWLHHCNVDRLLAIWQGIRSNDNETTQWWTEEEAPAGYGPASPLYPFRKSGTRQSPTWWISTDVRNHRKMGYDYPETAAALTSPDGQARFLTTWVNETLSASGVNDAELKEEPREEKVFEESISKKVPFWPDGDRMAIDGDASDAKRRYTKNMGYLGSRPALQPRPAPRMALAVASTAALAPHAPEKGEEASPPDAPVTHATRDTEMKLPAPFAGLDPIQKQLIRKVAPAKYTTPEQRCGAGHKLVCHNKITHWGVSFTVDKFCLDGSFHVVFFLGNFNSDPGTWRTEPHVAGASFILASNDERIESGGCDNCKSQKDEGMKYGDELSLTDPILSYYRSQEQPHDHQITDLSPDVVVPFLKRELHWRVLHANGNEVTRDEVPSLTIGVYSETVHLPADSKEPPYFEDRVLHYDVTDGRRNGLNQGETF